MDFALLVLSLIANGLDPSDPTFVFLFWVAVLIMLLAGCDLCYGPLSDRKEEGGSG